MTTPPRDARDDERQIEILHRLVMALAERLAIVAEHLGTLAERKDRRQS